MPLYRYDNWQDIAILDLAQGETGMCNALLLAPIRFLSRGKELVTKYSVAMTGLEPVTFGSAPTLSQLSYTAYDLSYLPRLSTADQTAQPYTC